jgi:Sigma-70, region 4
MNDNVKAAQSQGARSVVRLPRFGSVPECTTPASEAWCSNTECRYHLAHRQSGEHHLDPQRDCALSVANEGPHTLEEVAQMSGVTREWVRQIEASALEKLAGSLALRRQYDASE